MVSATLGNPLTLRICSISVDVVLSTQLRHRRRIRFSSATWGPDAMAAILVLRSFLPDKRYLPDRCAYACASRMAALVGAVIGASASLMLCYMRTMKKTVEEPDLMPGRRGKQWTLPLGNTLQKAVVSFSMRSLARSRQHRVVYAFFLAIAFAMAVSTLAHVVSDRRTQVVTSGFLMSTMMMMCLAVAGLRSIFSLPVSLRANWVLQVTQLSAPEHYIAAARRAMLVLSVVPVWLTVAGLSLCYRPWHQVTEHLLVLALAGSIMTDAALIGVSKIPFACSYLPGKSNVQYIFWAFVLVFVPLAMMFSRYELSVLDRPVAYAFLVAALAIAAFGLWFFNHQQAKSAVIYYEDSEPDVITTIGIGTWQPLNDRPSTPLRRGLVNETATHFSQPEGPRTSLSLSISESSKEVGVMAKEPIMLASAETVLMDIRYAIRMILKNRWFSCAVVLILAFALGLNTMVFTLVYSVLFKPVPVPNGTRLVVVTGRSVTGGERNLPLSYPDFLDLRANATSFQSFEAASDEEGILSEEGNPPQTYHLERTTLGIFSMLHAQAILGRTFLPRDDNPDSNSVIVLSYNVWKGRYGGQPNIVGRTVRVSGEPVTVIGVMANGFHFPTNVDLWMPLKPTPAIVDRNNRVLQAFAILRPGVTLFQANTELSEISRRLELAYPGNKDLGTSVLTFQQRFNGGNIRIIFTLMLASVAVVLLIACADIANMMLSRSLGRQREMAIRTSLGASRWRVVRQLLIESLLVSILGGLLGLGLAAFGVHWFDHLTKLARPYWISFTIDYSVFTYFALLCIMSSLLFGVGPALRSSRRDLLGNLQEGARSVGRHRGGWVSGVLVIAQFALTLVLLSAAGILVRNLLSSLGANPFVPSGQLTTARLDLPETRFKDADARERFYDRLLPRLRSIPGVSHVALVSNAPGLGAAQQQIELENTSDVDAAQRPWISLVAESPGYFETIQLPLLRGRTFNEIDGAAYHKVAILTRGAESRFWPGQDPIGRRFQLIDGQKQASDWLTVVGVSGDLVQNLHESDAKPLIFVPIRQEDWNNMTVIARSADNPLPAIRSAVQSIDDALPLNDPSRLDQAVEHDVSFLRLISKIFITFGVIALLMACGGIYAVIAHATSSRTQEIGVRIALGADLRDILLLFMARGLWQIGGGLILGLVAAWPLARFMSSLPIGISHSEPTVVFVVSLILSCVGIFACWIPAHRATLLDPVKAIRNE